MQGSLGMSYTYIHHCFPSGGLNRFIIIIFANLLLHYDNYNNG